MQDEKKFLPIKIFVNTYSNIFEVGTNGELFNKDRVQLFELLNQPKLESDGNAIQNVGDDCFAFDEDLYLELLNVETPQDAEKFFEVHPTLRFYFTDLVPVGKSPWTTKDEYLNTVVRLIEEHRIIDTIYRKLYVINNAGDSVDAIKKQAVLVDALNDEKIMAYLLNNKIMDMHTCTSYEYLWNKITDILQKYVDAGERKLAYPPAINHTVSSLLPAMYTMMIILTINNVEYGQCANKRCRAYFKINKSRPQTLCPKHLAVRQKKRATQLNKKNNQV